MALPLPGGHRPPLPMPAPPAPKRYDDFAVAAVKGAVRVDLYGQLHMPGDRCVAMLTPDAALQMSRQLAAAALKEGAK